MTRQIDTSEEEAKKALSQLGFSTNEIQILLELYQSKDSKKADQLSALTGVPLTRTYEALELLENKGFIDVNNGRPRTYRAVPPDGAISNFLNDMEKKYEEKIQTTKNIAKNVQSYVEEIYLKHNMQIDPSELLQQFSSLPEAEQKTIELIKTAEEEILIFTHIFQWFTQIEDYLVDAINRGCRVKILMQTSSISEDEIIGEVELVDLDNLVDLGIEVRNIPEEGIMTRGTLVDRSAVIFVIWAEGQSGTDQKRIFRPQFSSNQGIVDVFYGYFNYLWEKNY